MIEAHFLRDLVVLLAASLPIVFLSQQIRLPSLVGFLVTGALIGPSGLAWIRDREIVDGLAEAGVVLLLFSIGMEFSFQRLARMGRLFFGAGGLQVLATVALVALLTLSLGATWPRALLFGFVVALSSTAIALKTLADRATLDAPHGQAAVAVLLFQDLSIVPMMMLLPVLAAPDVIAPAAIARSLTVAVLAIGTIVVVARIVFPVLLHQIVRLGIPELFVATTVLVCFGTAWVTGYLGLSLAIGAFVAGLVVSESEYSHQMVADMLPLRDLFSSLFFMSMGMLFDPTLLVEEPVLVLGLFVGILVLKTTVGALAVLPFCRSPRVAMTAGMLLAPVGEFSFVLGREGARLGLLPSEDLLTLLNASAMTMLASPLLFALWERIAGSELARSPGARTRRAEDRAEVIIIGYGLNGRNLSRVLRETGIRYRILELNAETFRRGAAQGEPITFGDATRTAVLEHVGARSAAVVVVAISDPAATRRVTATVRRLNPSVALIVRTRHVREIEDLKREGADEVISEEFETSVEIFARVLSRLHVPHNVIQTQVDLVRSEGYAMLRGMAPTAGSFENLRAVLAASTTETHLLRAGSPAVGRSIRELDLRRRTGTTIIAVVHDGQPYPNPPAHFVLQAGNVLVLLGSHRELAQAEQLLRAPSGRPAP